MHIKRCVFDSKYAVFSHKTLDILRNKCYTLGRSESYRRNTRMWIIFVMVGFSLGALSMILLFNTPPANVWNLPIVFIWTGLAVAGGVCIFVGEKIRNSLKKAKMQQQHQSRVLK